MEDLLARVWTDLAGRLHGPLQFRLVLQPLMATLLAVRAGVRDARAGRLPYVRALVFDPASRGENLRSGRRDVGVVFLVAAVVDVVYQLIALGWIYPGEALIVAFLLADVPYVVLRALANRVATRFLDRQACGR
jgi:hypothetical protein